MFSRSVKVQYQFFSRFVQSIRNINGISVVSYTVESDDSPLNPDLSSTISVRSFSLSQNI